MDRSQDSETDSSDDANDERRSFEDSKGEVYELLIRRREKFIDVHAKWRGYPVGRIYTSRSGDSAALQDVVIHAKPITHHTPKLWVIQGIWIRSFRGRGLGSLLLRTALTELARLGVRRIDGDMHGDLPKLRHWYGKHGFQIADDDNHIWRMLP